MIDDWGKVSWPIKLNGLETLVVCLENALYAITVWVIDVTIL